MNDITCNYYKVDNIHHAASAAGDLASLRSIPTSGVRETPGGMSTYRVLLIILRTRQYLIGGRAAIEVIAFTKRHVSKETLLVLRNKISASGWYSSGNPVVPP